MIALGVLLAVVVGFTVLAVLLARTIRPAPEDPCLVACQYAQDVGMTEHSCWGHCRYAQWRR